MNKVITINLGGIAYQLEEAGFDALRAYLDAASARLQGNPDRDEIISDIERAIGDKFRGRLNGFKTVIVAKEVDEVIAEMGPVEDDSGAKPAGESQAAGEGSRAESDADASGAAAGSGTTGAPRRLYCLQDGAMLCGVCNGLGAYFQIDPTWVRLAFILLTVFWGTGIVVYLVMALVIPTALSAEQKAAAFGAPATAREFIRRARQGYYEAIRGFPDRKARREWKRRFKQDMRDMRANFRSEARSHAAEWRQRWYGATPAMSPGMGVALPLVSVLHGALTILWLAAIISLLATGALFGVILPAGMPVWAAILVLLFLYSFVAWPLKAMRRAFYYSRCGGAGWAWPFVFAIDVVVWIAVVVVMLWLANRFWPQAHEAIRQFPVVVHEAANDIRDWWHSR
jgi:phage shock protein PspC (stress-responsive transcriptional regulator)